MYKIRHEKYFIYYISGYTIGIKLYSCTQVVNKAVCWYLGNSVHFNYEFLSFYPSRCILKSLSYFFLIVVMLRSVNTGYKYPLTSLLYRKLREKRLKKNMSAFHFQIVYQHRK